MWLSERKYPETTQAKTKVDTCVFTEEKNIVGSICNSGNTVNIDIIIARVVCLQMHRHHRYYRYGMKKDASIVKRYRIPLLPLWKYNEISANQQLAS